MNHILKIEKVLKTLDGSAACSLQSLNAEKISASTQILKDIFISFFDAGISDQAAALLKSSSDAKAPKLSIVKLVTKHCEWIQHYIPVYARNAIDFQGETSDERVYEVRSGIEFMFSLFKNHSNNFDQVLDDIKVCGSVEDEFDANLKLWLEGGNFVTLKETEVPKNLPKTHWWWFKAV